MRAWLTLVLIAVLGAAAGATVIVPADLGELSRDARAIVRNQKKHIGRICGGWIVDAYRRHEIAAVIGKKLFPIFQTPFIEQPRFQI